MQRLILLFCCFISSALMAQQVSPTREADSLFFNMKYKEAAKAYRQFITSHPDAPVQAYSRLAQSLHFAGNYDEAIAMYDKVLKKQPGPGMRAQLYSRMAMTYAIKKDRKKAFLYLDSALANGFFNAYEMEHFPDFQNLRGEAEFRWRLDTAYNRALPCKTRPRARDFDFWVGEWEVFNNNYPNHRVGSSVIQNVAGECTILENWQAYNSPFSGKSQNWYDPNTGKWTQLWIGSGGGHVYFTDGEYRDGAMRFKSKQTMPNGTEQTGNFIFYNLGPDKVRQYYEVSTDGGKTFQVSYDFIYIRKKA
jgi:tetratricopeptide (TPR) repeat protein